LEKHSQEIGKEINDIWGNIRIIFCELYGLCDKLNIKRNEIPDIPNKWSIHKTTVEELEPIIEKYLTDKMSPIIKGGIFLGNPTIISRYKKSEVSGNSSHD